jgi:hypothetical protein
MDDPPQGHPADDNVFVKLTSLGVLGAGLLALFTGQDWFWLVFALGFAVLVPIVKLVTKEFGVGRLGKPDSVEPGDSAERNSSRALPLADAPKSNADAPESKRDALDALRDRYARGELSETEFERKVERLLETETLEGARDHVIRESAETTRESTDAAREPADPTREFADPTRETE